jgi:hypothetical protein
MLAHVRKRVVGGLPDATLPTTLRRPVRDEMAQRLGHANAVLLVLAKGDDINNGAEEDARVVLDLGHARRPKNGRSLRVAGRAAHVKLFILGLNGGHGMGREFLQRLPYARCFEGQVAPILWHGECLRDK